MKFTQYFDYMGLLSALGVLSGEKQLRVLNPI